MKSESLTCALIILLISLFIDITSSELEFYQDVAPETSENVSFKTLKRILELQNIQNGIQHIRAEPHSYSLTYEDYSPKDTPEKQKPIFEILFENPRIFEMLQKNKLKHIAYQQQPEYDVLNNYPRLIADRERPYVNLEPPSKSYNDPNINIPYSKNNVNEQLYFSHGSHNIAQMFHPDWKTLETNMEHNSMRRLEDNIINSDFPKLINKAEINLVPKLEAKWNQPEFTYKFDKPSITARDTFAVKPNDPRYYHENTVPSGRTIILNSNDLHMTDVLSEKKTIVDKSKSNFHLDGKNEVNDKFLNFRDVMPEPQRRTDRERVIVTSTEYKLNNDIYFIAIVAGCSAAAMFALVLISLTWCRLQRGAKAAADIDYPAYGVTGPNKDVSPSGDQRLAHSAQMYHFQHQKQQIISMEKTTATREPGSVSEAESDEENEEGDYTVYECPGLAPAGEMEVKNPLFHDDPTPATPCQNHNNINHSQ
ncbi:hypothetical protein PV326_008568 [Microctonus aethiopoides]|uniref:Neural proliferation differentiation and control protein 1 n=1 Tax=Microctonus aethiopoides TaxID=144406 RepID=A0AA39KX47_9HYME|nr:hypothetical protein PV326_008568 [Microctonus aethiopoides]KAK0177009.1 hypothetical protein PV328_001101 [Microctonus aethiopoides]